MKLVIEIPDELYNDIKTHPLFSSDIPAIERAIRNGTPLPKGHGRLIDADKLDVGEVFDYYGNRKGYKFIGEYELNNAPTIVEADTGK